MAIKVRRGLTQPPIKSNIGTDLLLSHLVYTLNIPLASTASVTAGLISYSDYTTFNGKVAGVTSGTGVTVSTTGNIATVNLATAGTAGTYAKVTTDAYGRVSAGTTLAAADLPPHSAALITSGTLNTAQLPIAGTAGTYAKVTTDAYGRVSSGTTLVAADLPPHSAALITSGTLSVASGGTGVPSTPTNGQVLIGNGTNYSLSTLTAGSGVNISNAAGAITISTSVVGSVTSLSTGAGLAGGPITSTGTLSLATVGTAGTYAKVTTDAYGRVSAGTTLSSADIPPISASLITSGTLNTAQLPTAGTAGTYAKVTTDAYGRVTAGTTLASSDVTSAIGFTPINKAGDTMSGALNLGSNDVLSTGNIEMAASKTLALSGNTADPTGLVSGDKGKTWYNSTTNQIKYWDGSTSVALGVAGSGLSSFNGQTGNTQTFATPGTTGTAPTWSSAANAHTLNIPLASTASVTAGLISNTDYNNFNGKVAGVTSGTGVTVSTTGNIATVNLAAAGTAGTYAKVTTDAYGRVSAGTTLVAADLPPHSAALLTSGTLSVANGGTGVTSTPTNGQVLIGNGTNYSLSTLTAGSGVSISNASGAITISTAGVGSVTSVAAGTGLTGGPITSSGTLGLATVGTAGTYAKVTTDAYGRVSAGSTLLAADLPPHSAALLTSGILNTAQLPTAGTAGNYAKVTTDAYGRVTAGTTLASSDVTSSLGFTPINKAGDTMNGSLVLPANGLTVGTNQIVLANGNVGIGTTSPGYTLDVVGQERATIYNSNNGTAAGGMWHLGMLNGGAARVALGLQATESGSNAGSDFQIWTYADSGSYLGNPLTIKRSSGNVGIGTTSPTDTLDIVGTVIRSGDRYRYALPNITTSTWYKLGTWTSTAQGSRAEVTFHAALGYSASTATNGQTRLFLSTGNQLSAPNITGYFWSEGGTSILTDIRANANASCSGNGTTCMSWDIYGYLNTFAGPDNFYEVKTGSNSTWTQSMTAATPVNTANISQIFSNTFNFSGGNVGIGTTAPTAALDVGTGAVAMGWEVISNTCNNVAAGGSCNATCTGTKKATGGSCACPSAWMPQHSYAAPNYYTCYCQNASNIVVSVYCANIR
ncbi:MAG: hypothetical protein NTY08_00245 [Proteobacteria bacterium]|nr:hypothetical protein [Pseudomonadota bacterium]